MAAYEANYGGYCSTCGSTSGCSCGCHGGCGGYDYPSCGPDYNPINTNNSFCPSVEGSQSQGGNATGNNSSVNVSVCADCNGCKDDECCCKTGIKKLLDYLYRKSLESENVPNSLCIYGDIIPTTIKSTTCTVPPALLSVTSTNDIQTLSISDDLVKLSIDRVSLCAISVIKFTFDTTTLNNPINELRRAFFYTPRCGCCCDCGPGIAEAIYLHGLGIDYNITLQDTVLETLESGTFIRMGLIEAINLVAVDKYIAIFSVDIGSEGNPNIIYFGIPTCRIAKFRPTPPPPPTEP